MSTINRIEIIGPDGRMYVKHLDKELNAKVVLQDSGSTMKIFLTEDPIEIK